MRALMWFRSDLRVRDNTALHHACKSADDGVVAVFVISSNQWMEHDWGGMKVDFVLRAVAALSASLAECDIPLLILRSPRFDAAPAKLLKLAKRCRCDAIFYNEEYEVNERRRDRAVAAAFEAHGHVVKSYRDQTILDVSRIQTSTGGPYTVFTPFKKRWMQLLLQEGPPLAISKRRSKRRIDIAPDKPPLTLRGFAGHARPDLWPADEREAGRRLKTFVSSHIYAYQRDRDKPDVNGTSVLSPYIAAGVVSPRQCFTAAIKANDGGLDCGDPSVLTWINELIWREFYRHILISFPRVCRGRPFRLATESVPWNCDESAFDAWREGRTGFPIVDAGMRQLAETGWMHNRVRMIVAMFLTKDLFIDWRWGERCFMHSLVDGDFASNNGGWQWSASTGTDAAPYFRIFNPYNQSRRFDPEGDYIRRFVPELAGLSSKQIHEPSSLARAELGYPEPIVDRRKSRDRVLSAFKSLRA